MATPPQISEIAHRILEADPDPVVRYRLQRDVLHIPISDLVADKKNLDSNPWVQQLAAEQHANGSWGRFHSRDSQSKQKIITTEMAVARGLALGLDASHPIFCRVVDYLTQLLIGGIAFPDRTERNDRWACGVQLFGAATLAQLKPRHPFIDPVWDLWVEILQRAFVDGTYSPEAEIEAHRKLTGATVKDSYLVLNNKYALALLSARISDLPDGLADQLLKWVWRHPQGIRYLGVPAANLPVNVHPTDLDHWFNTHALLARFPTWCERAVKAADWLWSQLGLDGLWDFGVRSPGSYYLPLSPNWRKLIRRKFDWSVRTLIWLTRYDAAEGQL